MQLINYTTKKIDNKNNEDYDKYTLTLSNGKYCYYYEKLNNKFVNVIEIVFLNNQYKNKLEDHKIYLFIDSNPNYNDMKDFIKAFNIEFSNIKYKFIVNNDTEKQLSSRLIKSLSLDAEMIDSFKHNEVVEEKHNQITEYLDYDLKDNILLKDESEEQKITAEQKKENAEYNGYNERLIDTNVKNIVSLRKNKKNIEE